MDIPEAIKNRRSIRRFLKKEIPPDAVDALKDALIWAPSAGNLQSRHFYFVFNQDKKESIVRAALGQRFIAEAPLCVVACADYSIEKDYGKRGTELYMLQDVAASVQNFMLLAHGKGLGCAWVGAFNEEEVSEILGIPDNLRPVAIVPVGYPDEKPAPPPRDSKDKAVEEIR
ncbi:MAG: nitroreductase family protein [Nitrospinota bacterium]